MAHNTMEIAERHSVGRSRDNIVSCSALYWWSSGQRGAHCHHACLIHPFQLSSMMVRMRTNSDNQMYRLVVEWCVHFECPIWRQILWGLHWCTTKTLVGVIPQLGHNRRLIAEGFGRHCVSVCCVCHTN